MHALTYMTVGRQPSDSGERQIREMIYRSEVCASNPTIYLGLFLIFGVMYYLTVIFLLDLGVIMPDVGVWLPTVKTHDKTQIKNRSLSLKEKQQKKLLLIHSGGDHISCSSVAKTQSVSNYSKITAWDSCAYSSVIIQRVIFFWFSYSGSTSNLKRVCMSVSLLYMLKHSKQAIC